MGQSLSKSIFGDSSNSVSCGLLLLEPPLGQGSFGVVYKAINQCTNKVHAVKKMNFTLGVTQRQKISREAELLKRTRGHANIVSLIGSFIESDNFYIIMEFCELGDLNRYVTRKNVAVDLKVDFMYDMSNGLDFLHKINIVHRDMKPANVLVTKSHGRPVCKISDLGEARMHTSDMTSDTLADYLTSTHGTMAYIAPEVLQGHYTKSCDVFSLGVVFYALFSAYEYLNPFVDGQYMYAARDDKIRDAVNGLQTLPSKLGNLTLKMLKKDYHYRVECGSVKATLTEARGNSFCILL